MVDPARRAALLGAALEVVLLGAGLAEQRADGLDVHRLAAVRGRRDRDVAVVEVVARAHELERLERLRGRAQERDERRLAGGGDDLAVLVGDGVDAVHGLDDPAAAHGYADRLHARKSMPEIPEMEAWRRALDDPVSAFPITRAGPAHVATLKTFDPPLSALEGRRFAGAERRGKRLLFPTDDGELVLLVHLMTAGRLRRLAFGEAGPKKPAFRLAFEDGSQLVLTEAGSKKRAGVWLLTPEQAEEELAHLGPDALELDAAALADIVHDNSRRLHSLLRDQRAIAGIGRAWANEILHAAQLSPYALTAELSDEEIERLADAMRSELRRGLGATRARRERQAHVPRPQPPGRALLRLRPSDRPGRLRGAHDLLLPGLPDRRARAQGPAAVPAPEVGSRTTSASDSTATEPPSASTWIRAAAAPKSRRSSPSRIRPESSVTGLISSSVSCTTHSQPLRVAVPDRGGEQGRDRPLGLNGIDKGLGARPRDRDLAGRDRRRGRLRQLEGVDVPQGGLVRPPFDPGKEREPLEQLGHLARALDDQADVALRPLVRRLQPLDRPREAVHGGERSAEVVAGERDDLREIAIFRHGAAE